jgi:hypothetical protein
LYKHCDKAKHASSETRDPRLNCQKLFFFLVLELFAGLLRCLLIRGAQKVIARCTFLRIAFTAQNGFQETHFD